VSIDPRTPYGRSKAAAERLVLAVGQEHEMHTCNIRPVLVYGPGVKGNLHKMLRAVDKRRFPPLPEVHNRRSLIYVGDVARALLLAAEHPGAAGQTFVVTDGVEYSTRQLYEAVAGALGRAVPPVSAPLWSLRALARAGDGAGRLIGRRTPIDTPALGRLVESAWYSSDRIRDELGYEPLSTFDTALPEMVAHYRASAH
ncbi:MAG: NAD-dependent epimerase/dehydratase family protein, partial [Actinomycetota bacterium]|nr:NAD-dependent epimerase/dehydratase family protein [Actinomycetota bacterium]